MKCDGNSAKFLIDRSDRRGRERSREPVVCRIKTRKTGKDGHMASKLKKTQQKRKEQYERRLANRLSLLSEKKTDPSKIEKDPLVKNLRANIEASNARLKAIAKIEQRTAELAKMKAEKAEKEAALKLEQTGGKEKEKGKEKGKDKGKEKEPKTASAEGKEKKKKKEKEPA
jgi:hypothetical protein